jgi:hypothetical protein
VLALLQAGYEDKAAIRRGVDVLVARQQADGDWVCIQLEPNNVLFRLFVLPTQYKMTVIFAPNEV